MGWIRQVCELMGKMHQTKTQKTSKAVLFFATILLSICVCLGCFLAVSALYKAFDQPTAAEGQQKADELIKALEEYKNDNGRYPSDLDILVPAYIGAIPQPSWNTQYSYEIQSNGAEFIISFDVGISIDGDYCEYSSRSQSWYCSDKI